MNVLDRFWSKVEITDGCWLWTGATSSNGYGHFTCYFQTATLIAHRFAYELTTKTIIPEGLQLDHLCGTRQCVRPDHLEAVTCRENLLRSNITQAAINAAKDGCPQGHPYDETNTYHHKGQRHCRACRREASRRYKQRRMEKVGSN